MMDPRHPSRLEKKANIWVLVATRGIGRERLISDNSHYPRIVRQKRATHTPSALASDEAFRTSDASGWRTDFHRSPVI